MRTSTKVLHVLLLWYSYVYFYYGTPTHTSTTVFLHIIALRYSYTYFHYGTPTRTFGVCLTDLFSPQVRPDPLKVSQTESFGGLVVRDFYRPDAFPVNQPTVLKN